MKRLHLAAVAAALVLAVPALFAQNAAAPKRTERVAMRDGKKLATDLYLPPGNGAFPALLIRTPYDKNSMAAIGAEGAKRGYAVVMQDTRGRFASEGENLPFVGDGWWNGHEDGKETVDWIRKQPWSSGKIGTWGGSALGITQLGLAGAGAKVDAQYIVVATPHMYAHALFPGGVFKKAMIEMWLAGTKHAPEALAGWLAHPMEDAYWTQWEMGDRWKTIEAPAIHMGGWYDIFAQGTIDSFLAYQTKAGPGARGKQVLVIGPWTHGGPSEKSGDLVFRDAGKPPFGSGLDWDWFDYHLKGEKNRWAGAPSVVYYVMGDVRNPAAPGNVWRTAKAWPPVKATVTSFYFQADRTLSTTKPTVGEPIAYAYDPKNPAPTIGGNQLTIPAGPKDQRALDARPDVVRFTTDVLEKPLEITGRVTAKLFVTSDCPDTDFVVRLCDVYPDGQVVNVSEGQLRLRFRESFSKEKLLTPGEVVPATIDLWSTSIIVNKGHRLRVMVTSSSFPGLDPNPNTGAPFRANAETRIANNKIFVDAAHASSIELPIVK